jgi:predicted ArsR family transcriptional regulator
VLLGATCHAQETNPNPEGHVVVEDGRLNALPSTRQDILRLLKFRREMGTDELAAELVITPGAVRHHLSLMARAGYVAYRPVGDGRGRPRFLYRLTEEGDRLFPTAYEELTLALLDAVREEAPQVLDTVLERSTRERLARAQVAPETSVAARLRVLHSGFETEGYMPATGHSSDGELTLHHCPVLGAARQAPAICAAELDYVRRIAGPDVKRAEWRLHGGGLCRYLLPDTSSARE